MHSIGQLPVSVVSLIRFVSATMVFLPQLLKYRGDLGPVQAGIEIGLWSSIGYVNQALSLQFISASKVSFFSGLGVLFVPLLDYLFRDKERSEHKEVTFLSTIFSIFPALLAFSGVAILECVGVEPPQWRDFILVLTPMSFALNFWRGEQLARKYPNDTHVMVGSTLATVSAISCLWVS